MKTNAHKVIASTCGDRILKNNHIDGTLNFDSGISGHLQLVDLQGNYISEFSPGSELKFDLM